MPAKKKIRKYCKQCGRYRSVTKFDVRYNDNRTWYFCRDKDCLEKYISSLKPLF
jgi:hypothetical protein